MKKFLLLSGLGLLATCPEMDACTGVSLTASDGSYVQARSIEWSHGTLESQYVIIPRGQQLQSYTPDGQPGMTFKARYGVVGLCVVQKEFIAEGMNEEGLSAGLFYFPDYGGYDAYKPEEHDKTLLDMQVVQWILSQHRTVQEVIDHIRSQKIVGFADASGRPSTIHWRVGEPSGRQIVIEIIDGEVHIHENTVGVLTNAPGFDWHLTNLNNYINLQPGDARTQQLGQQNLRPIGGSSAMLGLPGDATPPSRFVRMAFFRATAPVQPDGPKTVELCFHLLNNFDIPVGIEIDRNETAHTMSATQWTAACDLSNRRIYYKTVYNNTIRCIDLKSIDFGQVTYQEHPLDMIKTQPIEMIEIAP